MLSVRLLSGAVVASLSLDESEQAGFRVPFKSSVRVSGLVRVPFRLPLRGSVRVSGSLWVPLKGSRF